MPVMPPLFLCIKYGYKCYQEVAKDKKHLGIVASRNSSCTLFFRMEKEAIATTADTFQQVRESKTLLLSVVASVSATKFEMFQCIIQITHVMGLLKLFQCIFPDSAIAKIFNKRKNISVPIMQILVQLPTLKIDLKIVKKERCTM